MKTQQWRPSTRLRKRRMPRLSIIDLSGLAAVMVFLVAMFIVRGYDYVDLPKGGVELAVAQGSSQPGALKEDAVHIRFTRDDTVYFGGERPQSCEMGQIPGLIESAVQQGSEAKVYLHVDARAKYRAVKILLDEIRDSKIEKVVLVTYYYEPGPPR